MPVSYSGQPLCLRQTGVSCAIILASLASQVSVSSPRVSALRKCGLMAICHAVLSLSFERDPRLASVVVFHSGACLACAMVSGPGAAV
jgi:hypothetical protein